MSPHHPPPTHPTDHPSTLRFDLMPQFAPAIVPPPSTRPYNSTIFCRQSAANLQLDPHPIHPHARQRYDRPPNPNPHTDTRDFATIVHHTQLSPPVPQHSTTAGARDNTQSSRLPVRVRLVIRRPNHTASHHRPTPDGHHIPPIFANHTHAMPSRV